MDKGDACNVVFSTEMETKDNKATTTPASMMRPFSPVLLGGGEDSDFSSASTPKNFVARLKDLPSPGDSPLIRPSSACSQGGITAMRLQLESLNLKSGLGGPGIVRSQSNLGSMTPSRSGDAGSEIVSDGDKSPMVTYEVPLDEDFVSTDAGMRSLPVTIDGNGEVAQDTVVRKMTASDFEPLRCLGKGTYGTVILVRHIATGRLYAQKQFRKASLTVHQKLVEQTKTERTILESVNRHPFVVKLYYAFQDHEKLYLILEYAQGGELFTHLAAERMFSEDVAAFYMAEMVLALEHLHRNVGVVYRDMKPENCLLDAEGHLLLTDFGLSKVAVDSEDDDCCCRSILGTVEYMAPEVVLGKNYGTAVDWWSLGALGFDLLTGSPPFQGGNHAKIQEKIVKQKLSLPYYLSADAKDLLTRLLRKEPRKRLGGGGGGGGSGGASNGAVKGSRSGNGRRRSSSRDHLMTIKKHRFFRKIDWVKLERRQLTPPIQPLITDPSLAENFSSEFTELALSPVNDNTPFDSTLFDRYTPSSTVDDNMNSFDPFAGGGDDGGNGNHNNPFGGFSFVASSSFFERAGHWEDF